MQTKTHPGSGQMTWPVQHNKLLESITEPAVRAKAVSFFLAVLHPDVSQPNRLSSWHLSVELAQVVLKEDIQDKAVTNVAIVYYSLTFIAVKLR